MALSYYGINKTQAELGGELRPYQIPGGDNDDKSVTLEELAEKSKEFGLIPYHRPNGNIDIMKKFIAIDIPVITRTWLKENEDIGHYRLVRGFTDTEIIQDDSLQNKDLRYTDDVFLNIWKKFNYEYLVLVPQEKVRLAEQILGEDLDEKTAWNKAVELSKNEIKNNPSDIYSIFNLSVAYYNVGNYEQSVREFEKVESQLPFRTLWYQIEPIKAYYELGNYDKTLSIIDRVLSYHNRAFSELYIIRGNIYLKQGNLESAKREFEQAVYYNANLTSAQEALNSI
jgi:tetratricopeptide (TPR) repeat protein